MQSENQSYLNNWASSFMAHMAKNLPAMQETRIGSLGGKDPPEKIQYFCLENSMDSGGWRAIVHGVTDSDMYFNNQYYFSSEVVFN